MENLDEENCIYNWAEPDKMNQFADVVVPLM